MSLLSNAVGLVQLCARKAGLFVTRYPPLGSLERQLRDFLSLMEINVVLDVGAFVGEYALKLRELGYRGRIISFEPVPSSYERLLERLRHDASWSGQPFGLSDQDRGAVINTYGRGDFNSLLALHDDAERAYSLDSTKRGSVEIQLRRLDTLLPRLIEGVDRPRLFMKMDTQGHDLSVVRGATGVLDRILGLQSELPAVAIYDGMPSMPATMEEYARHGYVPIGFFPVNTFRDTLVSPEFDVLFKRFEGDLEHPGREDRHGRHR